MRGNHHPIASSTAPPVPKMPLLAPGSTIAVHVVKNQVTNSVTQTLIQQAEDKLRALLEKAAAKVKAVPGSALLSPKAFGNQVHTAFYDFLEAEQKGGNITSKLVMSSILNFDLTGTDVGELSCRFDKVQVIECFTRSQPTKSLNMFVHYL